MAAQVTPNPEPVRVQVKRVGDKLVCEPNEVHVKPGGTIVWEGPAGGPPHSGRFLGRVKNPTKKEGFELPDLERGKLELGVRPAARSEWSDRQPVRILAMPGVYAYTVEVDLGPEQGIIDSDPVVIVDAL